MKPFDAILTEILSNKYTQAEIFALTNCLEECLDDLRLESDNQALIEGLIKGLKKQGLTIKTRLRLARIVANTIEKDKEDKRIRKDYREIIGAYLEF